MLKEVFVKNVVGSGANLRCPTLWLTCIALVCGLRADIAHAQPVNDDWNNTILIGSSPFSVTGDNIGATTQADEQELTTTGATVWWFFTAPSDGILTVDTFGSDFDTVLHIYTGFELGFPNLIPVANNDQANGTNQSRIGFPVTAGQCYEIRVGGFFGTQGNIVLNGTMAPPPNDNFVGTINLDSTPFSEFGHNFGATTQLDEQQLEFTSSTVWWFFEAPSDGHMVVDTFGSDFDTVLHIYTGFELGFENLIPVATNDQALGTNQSQVAFAVNAGQCYEIRVGGFFGAQGNIVLNGSMMTPSNDNFSGSIALGAVDSFLTTGFNFGATTEPDEQQLEITGTTVWWFYTAPDDGVVTVDTFGSDFDTVLHIYTGFELGFPNLIPVANNDQAGGTNQSQVSFQVNAGQFYEIRVGGYLGSEGNISLQGSFLNVLLGDVNLDGIVSLLDVELFVNLINTLGYQVEADINLDGVVDLLDVQPFVELLSGP